MRRQEPRQPGAKKRFHGRFFHEELEVGGRHVSFRLRRAPAFRPWLQKLIRKPHPSYVSTSPVRRHSAPGQRVSDPEMTLHPEIAELGTGVHERQDLFVPRQWVAAGVAEFVAPQHSHFLGTQRVEEERGMGSHEDLRCFGCFPALLRQPVEQARMQEVLRLLDADERRRNRIVQQGQVSEHLERAVRREAGHDGLRKRGRP